MNRHLQVNQVLSKHPGSALDRQIESPNALVIDLKRISPSIQKSHKRILVVCKRRDTQGSHAILLRYVQVVALADQGRQDCIITPLHRHVQGVTAVLILGVQVDLRLPQQIHRRGLPVESCNPVGIDTVLVSLVDLDALVLHH